MTSFKVKKANKLKKLLPSASVHVPWADCSFELCIYDFDYLWTAVSDTTIRHRPHDYPCVEGARVGRMNVLYRTSIIPLVIL